MNMMQWVDDNLRAERKKGFPILSFPAIQKMGITVKELLISPDLQARAMKIVADAAPNALASVSFMDLSVEAEAFGSKIRFSDHEVPAVIGSILSEEEEADALTVPEIGSGRTGICIEAVRKAKGLITDRPVFAGAIGPFSLAGRLLDVSEAMVYCFEEPDMVHTVLEKVTEFIIRYAGAMKAAGADGVLIAEPLAGLLSPRLAEEFSAEYMAQIVEAVQTDDFLVVYHNCGNATIRQIESIKAIGCRMLHFGNAIDITQMVPLVPEDIIVMGNVDPAGQFKNGTPESVRARTLEVLHACGKYPNFIISSGCDIPPTSPWANIDAFFKAVEEFYT